MKFSLAIYGFLITFGLLYSQAVFSQNADAGPDKASCGGKEVEIGNMADNRDLCFSWKASPADPSVDGSSTPKVKVKPTKTTIYTLTVIGQDFSSISSDEVKVSVVDDVEIQEVATQKYGFDDYTDKTLPWKSVEKGASDIVNIITKPDDGFEGVFFKSMTTAHVTVNPNKAAASMQELTFNGIANGESEIQINCEKEDGDNIKKMNTKAYTLKTKTVAIRLVHETNYKSKDVSDADVIAFLNKKCYNQAVLNWTVVRLPEKTVNFDLNKDGKIDVDTWMSPEMAVVRDSCKDDSYDYNIFLVNNPSDGSTGFMQFGQPYGYVHPDISVNSPSTIAHELGHGAFSFRHTPTDKENIMYNYNSATKFRLRKSQWDTINP